MTTLIFFIYTCITGYTGYYLINKFENIDKKNKDLYLRIRKLENKIKQD